jgi:hypothetical protein
MKIDDAFPSKYLKPADLQGRQVKLTICEVGMRQIGNDNKPVVYFEGKDKGLVLNKTNAVMISEIASSDDTDSWPGVAIMIYPTKTDYQGKRVDTIRVDWPADAVKPKLVNSDGDEINF